MKKIFVVLCGVAILILSVYLLFYTNFYSKEQLDSARIKAVNQAREGNYKPALKRLELLVNHDADNKALWYDYLTVLAWSKNSKEFYAQLSHVDFKEAPDYFFDSAVAVIADDGYEDIIAEVGLLKGLFQSNKFLNSPYLNQVYLLFEKKNLGNLLLAVLEDERPEFEGMFDIQWSQQILNARNGNATSAVKFFEKHIANHKSNPKFLADYLTINNWEGNHEVVVAAVAWSEVNTMLDYGHAAIANSFKHLGQYSKALRIYTGLPSENHEEEILWLQEALKIE